jgi:monoamine oxidase
MCRPKGTSTWDGTDNEAIQHLAVLTAFAGGPAASSQNAPESIIASMRHEVQRAYPQYGNAIRKTQLWNWPLISSIRGGYSFPLPGEITQYGAHVNDGVANRVFFAGEHTCYAFPGYMEGALYSGVRTARKIAELAAVS